ALDEQTPDCPKRSVPMQMPEQTDGERADSGSLLQVARRAPFPALHLLLCLARGVPGSARCTLSVRRRLAFLYETVLSICAVLPRHRLGALLPSRVRPTRPEFPLPLVSHLSGVSKPVILRRTSW